MQQEEIKQDGEAAAMTVREAGKNHMLQFPSLLRNRRSNPRIRVPVQVHPPRRDRIQNLLPIFGVEVNTLRPFHLQRGKIQRRIAKGMPNPQRRIHRVSLL